MFMYVCIFFVLNLTFFNGSAPAHAMFLVARPFVSYGASWLTNDLLNFLNASEKFNGFARRLRHKFSTSS